MPQEPQADSLPLVGAFDDARNVGHDEGPVVPVGDNPEIGLQGGEGIVGDLGFGRGNAGEEGGFAGVRESYETYVREDFQFHDEPSFHSILSRLCVAGGLLGSALEVVVAIASAATLT